MCGNREYLASKNWVGERVLAFRVANGFNRLTGHWAENWVLSGLPTNRPEPDSDGH
jgi:hypothetical protein